MTTPTMPFKNTYKPRKNRSKNDPTYESDLFTIIEQLLKYAYTTRNFKLNHRSNRNSKRNTNLNKEVYNKSIIDLMKEFLLKKDLYETHCVPQDLKFFRKFHNSYAGSITFSTLYKSFRDLKTKEFIQKFPSITLSNLSLSLSKQLGIVITDQMLNNDYETIKDFLIEF